MQRRNSEGTSSADVPSPFALTLTRSGSVDSSVRFPGTDCRVTCRLQPSSIETSFLRLRNTAILVCLAKLFDRSISRISLATAA